MGWRNTLIPWSSAVSGSASLTVLMLMIFGEIGSFRIGGTDSVFSVGRGYPRSYVTSTTRQMATWSNGQAVREYQDFLASGKIQVDSEEDGPSVVVTSSLSDPSPLSQALVALGGEGGEDLLLQPYDTLPDKMGEKEEYPIYITLPPSELRSFLSSLNEEWTNRQSDFCFLTLEDGCIEPILRDFGYARDSTTQIVPSFTFQKPPQDCSISLGTTEGSEEETWAGESASCGKWKDAIAQRLERHGIRCNACFYRDWRRIMWERVLYHAVFQIVGAVRVEKTTFADVAMYYGDEASDLLWEYSQQVRGWFAVTLTYGFEERIFALAAEQAELDCTLPTSQEAYDIAYGMVEPGVMVLQYLHYAKDERGLLENVDIPSLAVDKKVPTLTRRGNLRADGVI